MRCSRVEITATETVRPARASRVWREGRGVSVDRWMYRDTSRSLVCSRYGELGQATASFRQASNTARGLRFPAGVQGIRRRVDSVERDVQIAWPRCDC